MQNPETTLFVGGLHGGATEDTLVAHFRRYGVVSGVKLFRNEFTGTSLGFGFVTFADPSSAHRVLYQQDLRPHRILRKKVNVKRWDPRRIQELMLSHQPPLQSTRMNGGYRSSGTTFVGGVESNNRCDTGDHQSCGSTSRSDYIVSPAPTNNGVPHPYSGRFTSEIGVNGDRILQGRYAGVPSSIFRSVPPQESMDGHYDVTLNVPQMSMDGSGIHRNFSQVWVAPIDTRPNIPPVPTYSPANMSRDGGRRGATGSQTMHNRMTAGAMNQQGFVSQNALGDVNSSREEYERLDFDGAVGEGFSRFHGQP